MTGLDDGKIEAFIVDDNSDEYFDVEERFKGRIPSLGLLQISVALTLMERTVTSYGLLMGMAFTVYSFHL